MKNFRKKTLITIFIILIGTFIFKSAIADFYKHGAAPQDEIQLNCVQTSSNEPNEFYEDNYTFELCWTCEEIALSYSSSTIEIETRSVPNTALVNYCQTTERLNSFCAPDVFIGQSSEITGCINRLSSKPNPGGVPNYIQSRSWLY